MSPKISTFRSAKGEAKYLETYDAVLKQWPVPYEELYIPTSLGDTHVVASGKAGGVPLLLLHPSGVGAVIWQRNVAAFSEHFRTFAVDTIGEPNKSVLTQAIKRKTQGQQFAVWFTDLVNGLGIDRTHVVGNSFGGFLALNAVVQAPERIRKAVLISPAATFMQMWSWYWHFMPSIAVGRLTGSKGALLRPYEWIWQGFPLDDNIAKLRALTATEGRHRHGSPSVFNDSEMRKIQTPILLLIGDHEVIYNPRIVIEKAMHKVPSLRAEVIPNANHNAEYTAAETINTKIIRFLSD
jgi:pimeloyl-ACP methyl ester carboxylesterase